MNRWIKPITLKGKYASLEPLSMEHANDLAEATKDGELWKLWYTAIPSPETAESYVNDALKMFEDRTAMPFVIREKEGGEYHW